MASDINKVGGINLEWFSSVIVILFEFFKSSSIILYIISNTSITLIAKYFELKVYSTFNYFCFIYCTN